MPRLFADRQRPRPRGSRTGRPLYRARARDSHWEPRGVSPNETIGHLRVALGASFAAVWHAF
eukprot:2551357-Pyramimonas_sp.AAC.1